LGTPATVQRGGAGGQGSWGLGWGGERVYGGKLFESSQDTSATTVQVRGGEEASEESGGARRDVCMGGVFALEGLAGSERKRQMVEGGCQMDGMGGGSEDANAKEGDDMKRGKLPRV
jgi:hypothetical protein